MNFLLVILKLIKITFHKHGIILQCLVRFLLRNSVSYFWNDSLHMHLGNFYLDNFFLYFSNSTSLFFNINSSSFASRGSFACLNAQALKNLTNSWYCAYGFNLFFSISSFFCVSASLTNFSIWMHTKQIGSIK